MTVDDLIDAVDRLITALESLGIPVYRQGSFPADTDYPPDLITFWNPSSEDHAHYDNGVYGVVRAYTVYVYSTDPEKVYTIMQEVREKIRSVDGITSGAGYDVSCDVPTHTGRAIDVLFIDF